MLILPNLVTTRAYIGVYNFFNFPRRRFECRGDVLSTRSIFIETMSPTLNFLGCFFYLVLGYHFVVVLFLIFCYFLSFSGLFLMMFTFSMAFDTINSLIWRHLYSVLVEEVLLLMLSYPLSTIDLIFQPNLKWLEFVENNEPLTNHAKQVSCN